MVFITTSIISIKAIWRTSCGRKCRINTISLGTFAKRSEDTKHLSTVHLQIQSKRNFETHPSQNGSCVRGTIPKDGNGLAVKQYAEVSRSFSDMDVEQFSHLIQDTNPIHRNEQHLTQPIGDDDLDSRYRQTGAIVHGMQLSSLFSSIFGTLIPNCMYRSQTLNFRHPVFTNEMITGAVKIIEVKQFRRNRGILIKCITIVTKDERTNVATNIPSCNFDSHMNQHCVNGIAEVYLPFGFGHILSTN
mmetsp:Transcript_10404/g.12664  ORF Transcript_10404/g.12664 Transcript_10404/m.12664 type:complete len:246 (+) Transcript_10404:77-814(+)